MYEAFFGLQQEPFSIATDPRFLYLTDKHREALALFEHGIARGASFVMLTGEIGAGKTTVWRSFLASLPSHFDVANVVNPRLAVDALLARICDDLHVELPPAGLAPPDLIDALHGHLLLAHAQGRRTLIVIDEAQALSAAVMEQLRLLTNLDSSGRKLHVLLIGQPELRTLLEQPQLEPLAQRIVARYHLPALSSVETAAYVEHRLKVAGLAGRLPFDGESLGLIHRLAGGIPRRINVLCDRALVTAFNQGSRFVDARAVEQAAIAAYGAPSGRAPSTPREPAATSGTKAPLGWAMAGMAAASVIVGAWLGSGRPSPLPARGAATPMTAAVGSAPEAAATPAPTSAATAAAVSAVPAALLTAVFNAPAAADERAAWQALAARWGEKLSAEEPCAAAPAISLFCWRSRDGLAPIRQLDRPGVVRLIDARGRVAFALLTGLGPERAMLSVRGAEIELPLDELVQGWRGEFATFWRAPPGYREGELPTEGSPLGRWLDARLPAVSGPVGSLESGSDNGLRSRVFAFQLAHGLAPDGLAGPLTLIQLNRSSGVDEPRLVVLR